MSDHTTFDFSKDFSNVSFTVNAEGILILERAFKLPIRITVKGIRIVTKSGCLGRQHTLSLKIVDSLSHVVVDWANEAVSDCTPYSPPIKSEGVLLHPSNVTVYTLSLGVDGFLADETVTLDASVKYTLGDLFTPDISFCEEGSQ